MSKKKSGHKTRIISVELPPKVECPDCGCLGLHMCVGRRDYESVAYVGVRSGTTKRSK